MWHLQTKWQQQCFATLGGTNICFGPWTKTCIVATSVCSPCKPTMNEVTPVFELFFYVISQLHVCVILHHLKTHLNPFITATVILSLLSSFAMIFIFSHLLFDVTSP